MTKIKFTKPVKTIDEKIELLQQRWLIINDINDVKHDLQHIGYFRMTGYFKFFQEIIDDIQTDTFIKGTTFQQVLDLYIFDRKLRLLTLDAIEKIEVSFKASINDYMSENFWCFWFLDESLFSLEKQENKDLYKWFIDIVKRIQKDKKAIYVKEYFKKYDEDFLPAWMVFEELTIWNVSTILNILKSDHAKEISHSYNAYYVDIRKWLNLITQVRNISAHHSRLWNNGYKVRPRVQDTMFKEKFVLENLNGMVEVKSNYYNTFLIIEYLLRTINKWLSWSDDLIHLFDQYPNIPKEKMWFEN